MACSASFSIMLSCSVFTLNNESYSALSLSSSSCFSSTFCFNSFSSLACDSLASESLFLWPIAASFIASIRFACCSIFDTASFPAVIICEIFSQYVEDSSFSLTVSSYTSGSSTLTRYVCTHPHAHAQKERQQQPKEKKRRTNHPSAQSNNNNPAKVPPHKHSWAKTDNQDNPPTVVVQSCPTVFVR
uniref:Uncharacterized protein n=1 Tax=Chloropicon primus TaxID=1764295 RepID=A0A7S2X0T6_9CHLO